MTCQCKPTSKNLFTSALCGHTCSLEDLQGAIDDRDGWKKRERVREREKELERERERERVREIRALSMTYSK